MIEQTPYNVKKIKNSKLINWPWVMFFSSLSPDLFPATFIDFILYTLLSLSGNLGRLTWVRLWQPQEQHYPVLQVHAGSFCFCNRPNSHMDCRMFNVRAWSFLCIHIYTQGLGSLTTSQHNIFYLEKLTTFSCAPDRVRTSGLWILSLTLYQLSHPVTSPQWGTADWN